MVRGASRGTLTVERDDDVPADAEAVTSAATTTTRGGTGREIGSIEGQLPQTHSPTSTLRNNSNSVRAYSRKNRVYVLRDFLLRKYENDCLLRQANGEVRVDYGSENDDYRVVVLDVAGGKGDLSWLLRNVDGIESVVVDPRVTSCRRLMRSVEFLRANPDEARNRSIPNCPTYQPLSRLLPKLADCEEFVEPRHMRVLVDQELVEAVRSAKASRDLEKWRRFWTRAIQRGKEGLPLKYKHQPSPTNGEHQRSDVATITCAERALDTILSTRLVVGFHPDQATDYCIDLAAVLGVPFCVVPCCVFPREFPHRRLASLGGQEKHRPVRNYEELIEYLTTTKAHYCRRYELEFEETTTAKNTALYTLPGDCTIDLY